MNSGQLSKWIAGVAAGLALSVGLAGPARAADTAPLKDLIVPPGFQIGVYADGLRAPRSLALADDGTVYVGSRESGEVIALRGIDPQGHAVQRFVVASGLNQPNGVAARADDLYVAEIGRILRFPAVSGHLEHPPAAQVVRDDLPTENHHGARYIGFGPDGKLYLAIGAPCNVCEPAHFQRGTASLDYGSISRMDPDGSHWEEVARGIRNSVGFTWSAQDHVLWFTNNGRDLMGDDLPSDTLNAVQSLGQHFGFPYCHQGDLPDPEYGLQHPCSDFARPALSLGAHVASLGIRFSSGNMFPSRWQDSAFIAEHGSWNRSSKVGYRVVAVHFLNGRPVSEEPFVTGWLQNERVSGRPVDVLFLRDGSLLISDDLGGRIYRVAARP